MKKWFKVISFILIIFSAFSLTSFVPNNVINDQIKVCASGAASCIPNEGNCSANGLLNLMTSLGSDIKYINLNSDNRRVLNEKLKAIYNDQDPVLCVDQSADAVIKYVESLVALRSDLRPLAESDPDMRLYTGATYIETARLCAGGYTGQGLSTFAGCCPSNTNLVLTGSSDIASSFVFEDAYADRSGLFSYVACCPTGYEYYIDSATEPWTEYIGKCVAVREGEVTSAVDAAEYNLGLKGESMAKTSSSNPSPIVQQGARTGSPYICDDVSTCALIPYDDPTICPHPFNSTTCIGSSADLERTDVQFQCEACYTPNTSLGVVNLSDPMFDGFTELQGRDGMVAICNSDGSVQYLEGVNNSISDTEACLRSEGGTSGDNYQFCKSCRESGGVWSGVGCVDTTPTGIVTWIIRIAYGVMGGVALIQFIIAGIYYQTGQEEKVKEARKNIIATITGLAVLTFSILILRIIGINILDILPTGSI